MIPADARLTARGQDFGTGLAYRLAHAMGPLGAGALLAVDVDARVRPDMESWARLTEHSLVEASEAPDGGLRLVLRKGQPPGNEDDRALGHRLWMYTNFDCNLACDYCCVRSSPTAERLRLDPDTVDAAAREAADLGFRHIFLTGGEPFLHPDIDRLAASCSRRLPTTLLTNAMVFTGRRLDALRRIPSDRVTLQVSVDSPTPEAHDRHRGTGSWQRALDGIALARGLGFRVRVAATGLPPADLPRMHAFLDGLSIHPDDRVLRPIARRGNAQEGLALARADLQPELTLTARGAYWHPVGATDDDFLVTRRVLPVADALHRARTMVHEDQALARRLQKVFNCA